MSEREEIDCETYRVFSDCLELQSEEFERRLERHLAGCDSCSQWLERHESRDKPMEELLRAYFRVKGIRVFESVDELADHLAGISDPRKKPN